MSEGNGKEKIAVLGMPGYGAVTGGASRGKWRASMGNRAPVPIHLQVIYTTSSLLAQNFNILWCESLNLAHAGQDIQYFAMLHSDVEPQDWWLDIMIAELEHKQLDVLSAVVPIKDTNGLTSTALAHPSEDPWRVLCRLSMHEVFQLPETFTAEDVGHPLLLNTGCWVCKFNPEWAKKVYFTVNDRIVFNTKRNCYQAQVEPEDWFFSRLLNELGLKIGATRKVSLEHAGEMRFTNASPWGEQHFDFEHLEKSVLEQKNGSSIRFPKEIDGWLSFDEGMALADLSKGKRVLEIGAYCGRSTICIAQTAEHVVSIDYHDGRGTPSPRNTLDEFRKNLQAYNVAEKVDTYTPLDDMPPQQFDLAFIDGAHDYESVRSDIAFCLDHLAPDGMIAFHDYRKVPGQHDGRWDPGVTDAVDYFLRQGAELVSTHGTVAVVKPAHMEVTV